VTGTAGVEAPLTRPGTRARGEDGGRPSALGILGGTFDPVHCGHLRLALEVGERLGLDRVHLMPAPRPRLRPAPRASAGDRCAMIEQAIAGCRALALDRRELARPGPTRTVETLEQMRAEGRGGALCLILGRDSAARLERWHRWRELLELAHLVLVERPGEPAPLSATLRGELERRRCASPAALLGEPAGRVFECRVPLLEISSSRIRERLARGACVRYLVPDAVHRYITERGLYAEPD